MPPPDPRLLQQQGGPPPEEELPPEGPPPDQGAPPDQGPPQEGQPSPNPSPAQEPGVSPTGESEGMGMVDASPEEQESADQFVGKAWELIYSDQLWPQVLEMLSGGGAGPDGESDQGDPAKGLAMVTDMIVSQVLRAADDAGQAIQPDVWFHATGDILEELAEISRRAKIKDYSQDQNALEKAWFEVLDMLRERFTSVGEIDQAHAQQDFDKLKQMDADGSLEKIMRELAQQDQSNVGQGESPVGPNAPAGFQPKGLGTALEGQP